MTTAYRIARYRLALHLRTSRFALQATALMAFLAALYATAPAEAVGDSTLSGMFLFFLMAWAGFGVAGDPVMEQLLELKAGGAFRHHLGDLLFLSILSILAGALAVGYPAAVHAVAGGGLYERPPTLPGALQALALQASMALLGGATGWFFHPRVVGDRKLAALIALLLPVMGLVKPGIAGAWPGFAWVQWLFPPLADVALRLAGKAAFRMSDTAWCCGALLMYACALALIRWAVLARRRY